PSWDRVETGSSASRIRTYNPPVTLTHRFPGGVDYLITRPQSRGRVRGARGWRIGWAPHHLVSAPSRLTPFPGARDELGSGLPPPGCAAGSLNSPRFSTRHFWRGLRDASCGVNL